MNVHNNIDEFVFFFVKRGIRNRECQSAATRSRQIPFGVQGRSLWPMLTGGDWPEGEFDSILSELGIGGPPWGAEERPELHFSYDGPSIDELNAVTQSGALRMARKGTWKILYDGREHGELYDLSRDPGELENLWDDPAHLGKRAEMLAVLLGWVLRAADPLPRIKYEPKTVPHGWQSEAGQ